MDHSEVVAEELAAPDAETDAERGARIEGLIAGRVPDVRFLHDYLLGGGAADIELDPARIGLVGYSFGGWTVLATLEVEPRVRTVVSLGPGGSSHPRPGILPLMLTFEWGRDVPTLYLAAEMDPVNRSGEVSD
jgi:dienelactone hydrolase